jgi:hypothetical protein
MKILPIKYKRIQYKIIPKEVKINKYLIWKKTKKKNINIANFKWENQGQDIIQNQSFLVINYIKNQIIIYKKM